MKDEGLHEEEVSGLAFTGDGGRAEVWFDLIGRDATREMAFWDDLKGSVFEWGMIEV